MKKGIMTLGALAFLIPMFALAQSSSTGLLTVYVQVLNQSGLASLTPGQFTVSVSGQSPSLTNFPGSQQGTQVTLNPGAFNVTILNSIAGYVPSYSAGCNNTIAAGQSHTCVITMTPTYPYFQNPTPYPGPNQNFLPLSCQTLTPNVALGQNATFRAVGGAGGTYNWSTGSQNYPNAGPTLSIPFTASGSHLVTVTNAAQTAACQVTVSSTYTPVVITQPSYGQTYYPRNSGYPTYQTYPSLPRTGFGPRDLSTGIAFSTVLLIVAGLCVTPYVRKAFAIVSR